MKNRVVKLGPKQLRQLIRETIDGQAVNDPSVIDLHTWTDQWANAMKSQYDSGDPVMDANGPEDWNKQVDAASGVLYELLQEAVDSVETRLSSGEFY